MDDFSDRYATQLSLALWNNLLGNLQRLQLDVQNIAELHGTLTPMPEFLQLRRDKTAH